jgi:hypothetical protein
MVSLISVSLSFLQEAKNLKPTQFAGYGINIRTQIKLGSLRVNCGLFDQKRVLIAHDARIRSHVEDIFHVLQLCSEDNG